MKKIILIALVALVLGGCGIKQNNQNTPTETKKDSVFSSIRDAVTKQIALKCEYTDENGSKTTTYIKGKTVRMKGNGEQSNFDGLMKDEKFYMWDNIKKTGMILDLAKTADDGSVKMEDKQIKSIDDVIEVLEEKKNNCVVAAESSGLFEIPSDIKFDSMENFLK